MQDGLVRDLSGRRQLRSERKGDGTQGGEAEQCKNNRASVAPARAGSTDSQTLGSQLRPPVRPEYVLRPGASCNKL